MKTHHFAAIARLDTYAPRIIALGLLGVLLLLAITGCQNTPCAVADLPPVGDYTLVRVDDKTVPCNLTHEGAAMIVKSGVLTFNPDGTCRSLSTFAVPPHKDINREVKAACTRQGGEIILRWHGAGMTTGHLSDNDRRFTMANEGVVFFYQRQAKP